MMDISDELGSAAQFTIKQVRARLASWPACAGRRLLFLGRTSEERGALRCALDTELVSVFSDGEYPTVTVSDITERGGCVPNVAVRMVDGTLNMNLRFSSSVSDIRRNILDQSLDDSTAEGAINASDIVVVRDRGGNVEEANLEDSISLLELNVLYGPVKVCAFVPPARSVPSAAVGEVLSPAPSALAHAEELAHAICSTAVETPLEVLAAESTLRAAEQAKAAHEEQSASVFRHGPAASKAMPCPQPEPDQPSLEDIGL
jgi:hypothetical protein